MRRKLSPEKKRKYPWFNMQQVREPAELEKCSQSSLHEAEPALYCNHLQLGFILGECCYLGDFIFVFLGSILKKSTVTMG